MNGEMLARCCSLSMWKLSDAVADLPIRDSYDPVPVRTVLRHIYSGVIASHSPFRRLVTATGHPPAKLNGALCGRLKLSP
jgi:hypothetical protein